MTASNESFSDPVQVPRMWTVPPILPDAWLLLVPHALTPRTTMAIAARIRVCLPIGFLPPHGRTCRHEHAEVPKDPISSRVYGRPPSLSMNCRPPSRTH